MRKLFNRTNESVRRILYGAEEGVSAGLSAGGLLVVIIIVVLVVLLLR
jgi:hypothetical protein